MWLITSGVPHIPEHSVYEEIKVGDYNAVVPAISGQYRIYSFNIYVLDPADPFVNGFTVGDILIPFEKGLFTRNKVLSSVGDVLVGKIPGRQDDAEITMHESVYSCVLDVAIAIAVYNKIGA